MTTDVQVRAAGGVVRNQGRLLLIHRPKYDDWTFPKGKADEGESDEDCALREVREETGYECRLGRELVATSYVDSHGRTKRVRYWEMEIVHGAFAPTAEVDEIRWCTNDDAEELLTYPRDRGVLASVPS